MKTEDLVRALVNDLPAKPRDGLLRSALRLLLALLVSGALVGGIIYKFLSPSPHLMHAMMNGPDLTTIVTLVAASTLAVLAFCLSLRMQRPETKIGLGLLALPFLLLIAGLVIELLGSPATTWVSNLLGQNPLGCFALVSSLSVPILLAVLTVLKRGAPANPALLGATAGFLAAGITSILYMMHCPEPSLLFITAWHVPAVLLVGAAGARLGQWWLRW